MSVGGRDRIDDSLDPMDPAAYSDVPRYVVPLQNNYLRRRLASKGILTLGVTLSLCVCPPSRLYQVLTVHCSVYPVLCSFAVCHLHLIVELLYWAVQL